MVMMSKNNNLLNLKIKIQEEDLSIMNKSKIISDNKKKNKSIAQEIYRHKMEKDRLLYDLLGGIK